MTVLGITGPRAMARTPYRSRPDQVDAERSRPATVDVFTAWQGSRPPCAGAMVLAPRRATAFLALFLTGGAMAATLSAQATVGTMAQPATVGALWVPTGACWQNGDLRAGKCSDQFDKLAGPGKELYRSMGPTLKKWFDDNVNGHAAWGLINKKDTFIAGTWLGHDVFDFVDGHLDGKEQDTKDTRAAKSRALSPEEVQRGHKIIDVCRHMTPDQRKAFVTLLDLDTGRTKLIG